MCSRWGWTKDCRWGGVRISKVSRLSDPSILMLKALLSTLLELKIKLLMLSTKSYKKYISVTKLATVYQLPFSTM